MKEQSHYAKIQADHTKNGRLFRNNTGTAFQGQKVTVNGRLMISEPRQIEFGLCVGSSDLIGWTEIVVTPEMVGQKIAVFTAVEVKKNGKKPTEKQINFINHVNGAGGIGRVEEV